MDIKTSKQGSRQLIASHINSALDELFNVVNDKEFYTNGYRTLAADLIATLSNIIQRLGHEAVLPGDDCDYHRDRTAPVIRSKYLLSEEEQYGINCRRGCND